MIICAICNQQHTGNSFAAHHQASSGRAEPLRAAADSLREKKGVPWQTSKLELGDGEDKYVEYFRGKDLVRYLQANPGKLDSVLKDKAGEAQCAALHMGIPWGPALHAEAQSFRAGPAGPLCRPVLKDKAGDGRPTQHSLEACMQRLRGVVLCAAGLQLRAREHSDAKHADFEWGRAFLGTTIHRPPHAPQNTQATCPMRQLVSCTQAHTHNMYTHTRTRAHTT